MWFFPWLKAPPSTPLAVRPIVILADTFEEKQDMDDALNAGLASRGIDSNRTRVGWDIICRKGDPTSIHDLIRVSGVYMIIVCIETRLNLIVTVGVVV